MRLLSGLALLAVAAALLLLMRRERVERAQPPRPVADEAIERIAIDVTPEVEPEESEERSEAIAGGRVVNAVDGRPVRGALVRVYPESRSAYDPQGEPVAAFRTDADGCFEFATAGKSHRAVIVTAPGFTPVGVPWVDPGQRIEIELYPAVLHVLQVVDEDGRPVPHPLGLLHFGEVETVPCARFRGTRDGRLELPLFENGPALIVRADGFATEHVSSPEREERIVLKPEFRIAGVVVTPEGVPMPGLEVELSPPFRPNEKTTTGPEGRFEFVGLGEHTCTLTVLAEGYLSVDRLAEPGDDRVRQSQRLMDEGERITNVVFMGMGEPLLNLPAVAEAIRILIDPKGLAMAPRRLTVSTSGVVPKIAPLLEIAPINLAISLHATRDAVRDVLVPLNKRFPIAVLLDALRRDPNVTRKRPVFFEYTLLEGVNDGLEDARRLPDLLRGIPSKVNLIPANPHPGSRYSAPSEEAMQAFMDEVHRGGLRVMLRHSRGQDIDAACGQLANR